MIALQRVKILSNSHRFLQACGIDEDKTSFIVIIFYHQACNDQRLVTVEDDTLGIQILKDSSAL